MNKNFKLAGLTLTGREYKLNTAFDSYVLKKSHFLWTILISLGYDEGDVLGIASGIAMAWRFIGSTHWVNGELGTISVVLEMLDTNDRDELKVSIDRSVTIAVAALFCFDRAIASNSRNRFQVASDWLESADELYFYSSREQNRTEKQIRREIAFKGGMAKKAKYKPLKELAEKLVNAKNFKSRRNAAKTIAPEIVTESEKLGIALSKDQAEITIYKWLKEMGLPADI